MKAMGAGSLRSWAHLALAALLAVTAAPPASAAPAVPPSAALHVQSGSSLGTDWAWQNPQPPGNALHAVDFVDETHGWCVGEYGTVVKTVDGGQTWNTLDGVDGVRFGAVDFIDRDSGWAVGFTGDVNYYESTGVVLRTQDGGVTWSRQDFPSMSQVSSVLFLDSEIGWVAGTGADGDTGAILRTSDGGSTWATVQTDDPILSLDFIDSSEGWAVGAGAILHTVDGGVSWSPQAAEASQLCSVDFVDPLHGWAVGGWGRGVVLATSDGGETWTEQWYRDSTQLNSVHFVSASTGWAVGYPGPNAWLSGNGGTILATSDGGETWTWLRTPDISASTSPCPIRDVCFRGGVGWAVGDAGEIMRTDNGTDWYLQKSGMRSLLLGLDAIDASLAWAVGSGGTIVHTNDGGRSWPLQPTGSTRSLYAVDFVDAESGWAVGQWGTILATGDGGDSWTGQYTGTMSSLRGVAFTDRDSGVAVGDGGIVLTTSDGGDAWAPTVSGTTRNLNDVSFPSEGSGWAVGMNGTILRTDDAGTDWEPQQSGTAEHLQAVDFVDDAHGWAVGNYGTIRRTTDGGAHWTAQTSGTGDHLTSVDFRDTLEGVAVSSSGRIFTTHDGGENWVLRRQYTGRGLYGVRFPDGLTGWAVGEFGTVLHSGPLGPPPLADSVPQPTGPSAPAAKRTQLPVVVLMSGLASNDSESKPGLWGGLRRELKRQKLAADVLIAPTAVGSSKADVADSNGNLNAGVTRLATWLADEKAGKHGKDRIGSKPVILVGHSNGGVMMRGLLSTPSQLDRTGLADQIVALIQFASPNAGSWLAESANGNAANPFVNLGTGDVEKTPVILGLRPSAMSEYNATHRNTRRYPIDTIAGDYIPDATPDYRGTNIHAAHRLIWDEMGHQRNDGMVAVDSVENAAVDYAGGLSRSFRGTHGAIIPGNRDCDLEAGWPVATSLRGKDPQIVPQMSHPDDTPIFNWFTDLLRYEMYYWKPLESTGAQALSRRAETVQPVAGSRFLPEHMVAVTSSEPAPVSVALDATTTLTLASSAGTPTVSVTGAVVGTPTVIAAGDTVQTFVDVVPPAQAMYELRVGLAGGCAGEVSVSGIAAAGASLRLKATPYSSFVGGDVVFTAEVLDGDGGPVAEASVDVTAESAYASMPLELVDDGSAPDVAAGDGTYTGTFSPPLPGAWSVEGVATSDTFERRASEPFSVGSPDWARFSSPPERVTETTRGALITRLGVSGEIDVTEIGQYRFAYDIVDSGGNVIAQPAAEALVSAESTTLVAWVDAADLPTTEGTMTVANARLLRVDDEGEYLADRSDGLTLGRFDPTDFYTFRIGLHPLEEDPSPTSSVTFTGEAACSAASVTSVDYSLDGASTWTSATPVTGSFDSPTESFLIPLVLDDRAYGLLVRATTDDGVTLPPEDWAGDRFMVDTTPPAQVSALASTVSTASGAPVVRATWSPSETPTTATSPVRYGLRVDGHSVGEVVDTVVELAVSPGEHTLEVVPVDAAGNAGPAAEVSFSTPRPPRVFESIFGPGRVDTAVAASKRAFPTPGSADSIVLATGWNWPDALGGSVLAGACDAPLLLTAPDKLSPQVLDEARRLDVHRVIILGSKMAVSGAVESALRSADVNGHALTVERIGGADRFDTAAQVASATVGERRSRGETYDGTCFFATGFNFPDALAASPLAAAKGWPILLVRNDGLSAPTESAIASLGVTRGIVLGSEKAVTPGAANRLGQLLPDPPERVEGASRYLTAIEVARFGVDNGLRWDGVAFATGVNFPDALGGGVMQGKLGSVVLLTPGSQLDPDVASVLAGKKGSIDGVRFLGSTSVVTQEVRDAVGYALE